MSAVISSCGKYRYDLRRGGNDLLPFVMLNPSTADSKQDDPTIRRCVGFAKREGNNGIVVRNLYAWRSKSPQALKSAIISGIDVIGPENDYWLQQLAIASKRVVCAWGGFADVQRARQVVSLLKDSCELVCLGVTASGAPRHPLYVRNDVPLVPFNWSVYE